MCKVSSFKCLNLSDKVKKLIKLMLIIKNQGYNLKGKSEMKGKIKENRSWQIFGGSRNKDREILVWYRNS